jgi:hypothetical protein
LLGKPFFSSKIVILFPSYLHRPASVPIQSKPFLALKIQRIEFEGNPSSIEIFLERCDEISDGRIIDNPNIIKKKNREYLAFKKLNFD